MVDIQNLSKCFKVENEDLWAIKNVSMHINKGEIFWHHRIERSREVNPDQVFKQAGGTD